MPPRKKAPPPLGPIKTSTEIILENLARIEPSISPAISMTRITDIIDKFKHMTKDSILELFSSDYVNPHIDVTYVAISDPDRAVLEIQTPESKRGQRFYKSLGVSRGDDSIKGIWFPFIGHEIDVLQSRFIKPEDQYIISVEKLSYSKMSENDASNVLTLLRDPTLLLYGRFMDFANASIAARLYYDNI